MRSRFRVRNDFIQSLAQFGTGFGDVLAVESVAGALDGLCEDVFGGELGDELVDGFRGTGDGDTVFAVVTGGDYFGRASALAFLPAKTDGCHGT